MNASGFRVGAFATAWGLAMVGAASAAPQPDTGSPDRAQPDSIHAGAPHYSPYAGRNFPTRPMFGDTHLHTAMSFDAGMFGARLGPVEAYRFARGEEVTSSSGQQVRLSRPLDFLVVADHSDFMGLAPDFLGGKPEADRAPLVRAHPRGQGWGGLQRTAAALWCREDAGDDAVSAG